MFGNDGDKYGPDEAMRDAKAQGLVDDDNKVSRSLAYGSLALPASRIAGPVVSQMAYGLTDNPLSAFGLGMAAKEGISSLAPGGYASGLPGKALGAAATVAGFGGPFGVANQALGYMDKAATLQAAGIRSPNLDNGFSKPGQNQGQGGVLMGGAMLAQDQDAPKVSQALATGGSTGSVPWYSRLNFNPRPSWWTV